MFQFIRSVTPGFDNAYIVEIAPQIGIRETRRIVGDYVLTERDILGCRDFEDPIGVNGWPVEAHIKGDVKFVFAPQARAASTRSPTGSCCRKRIENLLVRRALRVDVA